MPISITFLGTGASAGIPVIGCECHVCKSRQPKNIRTRPSIVVHINNKNILIDTAPDLRLQAISNNIYRINSVLYTHHHADHILGLSEIKPLNNKLNSAINIYGSPETLRNLKTIFSYMFDAPECLKQYYPEVILNEINGKFKIDGLEFSPFEVMHYGMPVLAFRFNKVAYVTDLNVLPEGNTRYLEDLDVLILDMLREEKHAAHLSLEQSIEIVRRFKPKKTYFTHIGHEVDHYALEKKLPVNVEPAYDGLVIEV